MATKDGDPKIWTICPGHVGDGHEVIHVYVDGGMNDLSGERLKIQALGRPANTLWSLGRCAAARGEAFASQQPKEAKRFTPVSRETLTKIPPG